MEPVFAVDAMALQNAQARQVQADFERKWGKLPTGEELEQQQRAGQQAVYKDLLDLLPPALQQAVRDTQVAVRDAQLAAEQSQAAIERHAALRPRAGASPGDVNAWLGEQSMLLARADLYKGHVAEAAAAYQAARERLQAAMGRAKEQQLMQLQRELQEADARLRAQDQEIEQKLFDHRAAWQSDIRTRQANIERIQRYWPGQ